MITRVLCIVSCPGRNGFRRVAHRNRALDSAFCLARVLKSKPWLSEHMGGIEMADDRMKHNDRDLNMGGTGQQKDQGNVGQKTPGRGLQNEDDEFSSGQ